MLALIHPHALFSFSMKNFLLDCQSWWFLPNSSGIFLHVKFAAKMFSTRIYAAKHFVLASRKFYGNAGKVSQIGNLLHI